MIDISDGLGKDAMAIATSSHVQSCLRIRMDVSTCHPGSNWQRRAPGRRRPRRVAVHRGPSDVDCSSLPFEVIQTGTVTEGTPAVLAVGPEGLHIDGSDLEAGIYGVRSIPLATAEETEALAAPDWLSTVLAPSENSSPFTANSGRHAHHTGAWSGVQALGGNPNDVHSAFVCARSTITKSPGGFSCTVTPGVATLVSLAACPVDSRGSLVEWPAKANPEMWPEPVLFGHFGARRPAGGIASVPDGVMAERCRSKPRWP